jgi:allantoate deiminase
LRDAAGISVAEAIADRSPARERRDLNVSSNLKSLRSRAGRQRVLGYLEVHIEQGPVLETKNLSVGVVSAIAGQTRGRMTFRGQAGHAGTTPMNLRRDALAAAAEFVVRVESTARRVPGLVATVGTLSVSPGAANVIPGEVVLSLDVRHARDATRRKALREFIGAARIIGRRRKLGVSWTATQDNNAVACAAELTGQLAVSVRSVQGKVPSLVSGAGHDAVVMSAMTPVAMLFVRCRKGLSHHPGEYASPKDIGVALNVIVDLLARLGGQV